MRIGIVTLFEKNYNYGAVLQAYALERHLQKLGHMCEVLRIQPEKGELDNVVPPKNFLDRIIRRIRRMATPREVLWELVRVAYKERIRCKSDAACKARIEQFQAFSRQYIGCTALYESQSIDGANLEFDAFVCGSDQIWKPACTRSEYFLEFANSDKIKVAYAASIGLSALSQQELDYIIPKARKLDAVSVREERAMEILRENGIECEAVVDPTFLLEPVEWKLLAGARPIIDDDYIFCYFLSVDYNALQKVKGIARRQKKRMVVISYLQGEQPYQEFLADISLSKVGPKEFLNLIKYASAVYTDSFHGAVFSVIFGVDFWVFERKIEKNESMNSRIETLLRWTGAEKRSCVNDAVVKKVAYAISTGGDMKYYENIKSHIDSSKQYLADALSEEDGRDR